MKKLLRSRTRAIGLATLLTFIAAGVVLAGTIGTLNYGVTCSGSTPVEVGKVKITNNDPSSSASGTFTCTDDGPPPGNTWGGRWRNLGAGQSTTKGCATQYDLLTIRVDNDGPAPDGSITISKAGNYCEAP